MDSVFDTVSLFRSSVSDTGFCTSFADDTELTLSSICLSSTCKYYEMLSSVPMLVREGVKDVFDLRYRYTNSKLEFEPRTQPLFLFFKFELIPRTTNGIMTGDYLASRTRTSIHF